MRADPTTRALGLRLHDYFIARSIARLRPGGIALFVTSTGTMDKASTDRARAHRRHGRPGRRRASARGQHARDRRHRGGDRSCWCSSAAPTDRRPAGAAWIDLAESAESDADAAEQTTHAPDDLSAPKRFDRARHRTGVVEINEYFAAHPEMVLGEHAHAARHLRSWP